MEKNELNKRMTFIYESTYKDIEVNSDKIKAMQRTWGKPRKDEV